MKKLIPLLFAILMGLTGCIMPKSYVDPKFQGVTFADIKPGNPPLSVVLTVEGQTNGKTNKRASEFWRKQFEDVLTKTSVFTLTTGATATLSITINNVGDVSKAASQGFVTGLTFGAVGSAVTDGYEMTVVFNNGSGQVMTKTYQHAIHTVVGNAEPPAGVAPTKLSEAPVVVARDLLLHFIKDYQAEAK